MKKIFILIGVVCTLGSCVEQSTQNLSNEKKLELNEVEFLFEKDGIKVYSFRHYGNNHYFTNRGETITTIQQGKNSYREENIQ